MNNSKIGITEDAKLMAVLFRNRPKKQTAKFFKKHILETYKLQFENCKENIKQIYDAGYGIKIIARELNLNYSEARTFIIKLFGVNIRKGYNVVTNILREFRSIKAKEEGLGKDWPIKYIRSNKGIQGYYWNKSFNKYCWLRSSYEYIYAKFLDRKNIKWNSEEKYFLLENGKKYLPDFFIYENGKLIYVVEIKSNYAVYDRKKQEFFKECPIITVRDIKNYLENGSSLHKELILWKQNRILKLQE